MIDLDQARLNPSEVFASPNEVLQHRDLSRTQKIEVLRRWAQDAQALQVAEDENMTAPPQQSSSRLDEVMQALHDLDAELAPES
jgi:primosomal protein N''